MPFRSRYPRGWENVVHTPLAKRANVSTRELCHDKKFGGCVPRPNPKKETNWDTAFGLDTPANHEETRVSSVVGSGVSEDPPRWTAFVSSLASTPMVFVCAPTPHAVSLSWPAPCLAWPAFGHTPIHPDLRAYLVSLMRRYMSGRVRTSAS